VSGKSVYILSLGCPKNLVDSEVISALLARAGWSVTDRPDRADTIVVNTCAFILPAKEESIEEILRMAAWKKRGRCRRLVVTGCLPQRYGAELARELPEVDLFLGTGDFPGIPAHLERLGDGPRRTPAVQVGRPLYIMDASVPRRVSTASYGYLKIAEGCSNRCAYCVIPSIRGPFRSRPMDDIVSEAVRLAAEGTREIILVAQDTTAWGRDLRGRPTLTAFSSGSARSRGRAGSGSSTPTRRASRPSFSPRWPRRRRSAGTSTSRCSTSTTGSSRP